MSAARESNSVECMISSEQIRQRVQELGEEISSDYADRPLVLVGVLKGAWMFLADLVRQLRLPLRCDFVRVTSYGMGTETSGQPRLLLDITVPIDGADVLLVDDILDTGLSCNWLKSHLLGKGASSVRSCVLLDKPARRRVDFQADYVGFDIPDRFVVGYGLDSGERFRELPFIGYLKDNG